jgi:hypothetical protein
MTQGIDMSKSSWENPDGFTPRERPERAPAPEPVCEAAGPDGWVCDLKPNHRTEEHEADTGEKKIRWKREAFTSAAGAKPEPATTFNREIPPAPGHTWDEVIGQVRTIVTEALESQAPAVWAVALTKIEEMTHGY